MKTTYISNEVETRRQAEASKNRQEIDANGHLTADEAHLRDAEVKVLMLCQFCLHPDHSTWGQHRYIRQTTSQSLHAAPRLKLTVWWPYFQSKRLPTQFPQSIPSSKSESKSEVSFVCRLALKPPSRLQFMPNIPPSLLLRSLQVRLTFLLYQAPQID